MHRQAQHDPPVPSAPEKYRRCLVLSGGGFRFGIYLGMYEAACDAGCAPDVLLASCGGALAAAIIQGLPDAATRKAWLAAPAMYDFWRGLQLAPQAGIARLLLRAGQRFASLQPAPRVPDLFGDYLFELPHALPLPVPVADPTVAVAVVGARLLFRRDEAGQPRGQRKLFEETVFCDTRSAALLRGMASPLRGACWGTHAIADTVATDTSQALAAAACLSIVDFFYFPAFSLGGERYIGGVVDLFPSELAHRLADAVVMEFKQPLDQVFARPAWRAVLGIDGNQRLRHVHAQRAEAWVDTSDIRRVLACQQVHKQIDWRRNRVALRVPADHATYARHIEDQWQYGYARATEALRRPATDAGTMRNVNWFNRARPCAS